MSEHPHPLPGWLQYSMECYIGRPPIWQFPEFAETPHLQFERLSFDNREVVLEMFENDVNPFVAKDFKSAAKLYEYVASQRICGPYSPKHGCADWIVRTRQKEPVGLLHVYDRSRETWALNHRRCCIGYVIAEPFRGAGLAHEAVRALQDYVFKQLDMLMVRKRQPNPARIRRAWAGGSMVPCCR